jgi:imidazoleglycerol-phosphate dehydratase / histidinol-phosphatase
MRKILFVDRDGTLVREPEDFQVDRLDKIRLVEGVIPALLTLRMSGYSLVMVTNQDGLETGAFPKADFRLTHDFMIDLFASQGVGFEATLICPHVPEDRCFCRKPATGLLTEYLKDPSIDWQHSAVVGDRDSDLGLATAIGVRGYKLTTGGGNWTWNAVCQDLISRPRVASITRKSTETAISVTVNLDGTGKTSIATGVGFFDHLLDQLGRHSNIDISINVAGDLHIDDHHTIEDTGIALGNALRRALSDKFAIGRYGFSLPMDECRAEALIDLSGRAVTRIQIPFSYDRLGNLASEMIPHFFESLCSSAGINLHLTVSPGNNHHMAEAGFKAVARALRQAVSLTDPGKIPSSKGML